MLYVLLVSTRQYKTSLMCLSAPDYHMLTSIGEPAPQLSSLFLCKLAPELRNFIYELTFLQDCKTSAASDCQLLSTCRLIYQEARHIPLTINWHPLRIHNHYLCARNAKIRFLLTRSPFGEWGFEEGNEVPKFLKRYAPEQLPFLHQVKLFANPGWFEKEPTAEMLEALVTSATNLKKLNIIVEVYSRLDLVGWGDCVCQIITEKKIAGLAKVIEMFQDLNELQIHFKTFEGKEVMVCIFIFPSMTTS